MASTNKTTHYDLPQWIGTDKPTFLGDFNSAFNKIDATMYTADNNATNAVNTANQANSTAGEANTAVQGLTETVNDNTAKITTVTNLANTTAEKVNNIVQQSARNVCFSIGTYLSSFSPVVNQNVNFSTITIGNAKFLSIYGVLDISYTGSPTSTDIAATNLIQGTQLFKNAVEQMGTGTRRLNNIGTMIYPADGNTNSCPIDYRSEQNSILRLSSIDGNVTANSNITFSVQAFIYLGLSN